MGEYDVDRGFFFQAEDGIRDRNVTGVQTCALPISRLGVHGAGAVHLLALGERGDEQPQRHVRRAEQEEAGIAEEDRSEERRVGKEGRRKWGGDVSRKSKKRRRSE